MTKVSFVEHYRERTVLREVREKPLPELVMPAPEYTDTMYDDVFRDAQEKLGLSDLEPVYEDGQKVLMAPDGLMFRVTGAFRMWPDGNDIDWGYGRPFDSYEEWRRQHHEELAPLEKKGLSLEEVEQKVFDDDYDGCGDLDLHHFIGKSLVLSFNRVPWGATVNPEQIDESASTDEPSIVRLRVDGYKETWYEQAKRFVKLPNSASDRLLTSYEYGLPGVIPCWMGEYCEGDIEHMTIELVPAEEGVGDKQLPALRRLWLPESVRYSFLKDYPDLIDQGSDYNTRSNFGNAIRIMGGLAAGMGGREGNAVDEFAEKSQSHIVAIDDPILAHMDLDKLAVQMEDMITTSNERDPFVDPRVREQEESDRRNFEEKKKRLVVVTDVDGPIGEIVERVGKSDDWLKRHIGHQSLF